MNPLTHLLPGKGALSFGTALLLGLAPQLFSIALQAGDARAIQIPDLTSRDWILNNQARRAILKDDQLAPHNIGVTVKNKIATIWGSIPAPEIAKRAEATLLKIPGIATVMNECRIVPGTDPIPQAIADAVRNARNRGDDPNVSAKIAPPPPSTVTSRQVVAKPDLNAIPAKADEFAVMPPPPSTVLLAPTMNEPRSFNASPWPWERVRASDKRFKDLNLEVRNGIVKVSGIVARMKDAWDLAEMLNALPGVKQVIIGRVIEK